MLGMTAVAGCKPSCKDVAEQLLEPFEKAEILPPLGWIMNI